MNEPTKRGAPCAWCGRPINGRAWLRRWPFTTTCGRQCFMSNAIALSWADRAVASPMAVALAALGFATERRGITTEEKDHGEDDAGRPCVSYHACGYVVWRHPDGRTAHAHQSRWSETAYVDFASGGIHEATCASAARPEALRAENLPAAWGGAR